MDKQTAKLVTQAAAAGVITKKQAMISREAEQDALGRVPSVP
jgi:hypothetical protein